MAADSDSSDASTEVGIAEAASPAHHLNRLAGVRMEWKWEWGESTVVKGSVEPAFEMCRWAVRKASTLAMTPLCSSLIYCIDMCQSEQL